MNKRDDILDSLCRDAFGEVDLPVSDNLWKRIVKTLSERRGRKIIYTALLAGLIVVIGLFFVHPCTVNKVNSLIALNNNKSQPALNYYLPQPGLRNNNPQIAFNKPTPLSLAGKSSHVSVKPMDLSQRNSQLPQSGLGKPREQWGQAKQKSVPANTNTLIISAGSAAAAFAAPTEFSKDSVRFSNPPKSSENTVSVKPEKTLETARVIDNADSAKNPVLDSLTTIKQGSALPVNADGANVVAPVTNPKMSLFMRAESGALAPSISNSITGQTPNSGPGSQLKNLNYNGLLSFGFVFKNKLSLTVGLGISKFKNNCSYSGTGSLMRLDSILVSEGDTDHAHHSDNVYRDTTYAVKKNYTTMASFSCQILNVPIALEYGFTIGNKWSLAPSLGISINALLSAQSVLNNSLTNETIINNTPGFKEISFSALAGLRIGYNFNQKWQLYFSPSYSCFIGNLNKNSTVMNVSPSSTNLNLGLQYNFR